MIWKYMKILLRAIREDLAMSQENLGGILGMGQTSVCRMENSRLSPDLDTLEQWCEALGVELSVAITEAKALQVWSRSRK